MLTISDTFLVMVLMVLCLLCFFANGGVPSVPDGVTGRMLPVMV